MKPFLVALAMLAVPAPALAQGAVAPEWRAVSFVGSGDEEGLALVDVASLRKPGRSTRDIVTLTVRAKPLSVAGAKGIVQTRVTYRFDCAARTFTPIRTEAWSEKGRVMAGANDGPVRPVERGTIIDDLHAAVCDGAFAHMRPVPGTDPLAPSRELLAQRRSLADSRARKGWQRLNDVGAAPDRMQYFAERGSVVSDAMGRHVVSTMVLVEKVEDGINRIHYLVRVDCRARTGETIYAEAYDGDGRKLSEVLMVSGVQPLAPGRLAAALEMPICKGDWDTGAPETRLPDQLAREAFR